MKYFKGGRNLTNLFWNQIKMIKWWFWNFGILLIDTNNQFNQINMKYFLRIIRHRWENASMFLDNLCKACSIVLILQNKLCNFQSRRNCTRAHMFLCTNVEHQLYHLLKNHILMIFICGMLIISLLSLVY